MAPRKQYVSTQIEAESDTHDPSVYELLSFHQALQTSYDEASLNFIPLSTAFRGNTRDHRLFSVGIIPPSAAITGVLLDRTASVNALTPDLTLELQKRPDAGSSSTGDLPGQTSGLPTSVAAPAGPTEGEGDFWVQYVTMCNRLGCNPEDLANVIQSESGFRSNAVSKSKTGQPIAKGLFQLVRSTAKGLGMTDEEFDQFEHTPPENQLVWMEKFYKGRARGKDAAALKLITFGGYNNSDGSIYNSTALPPEYRNPKAQRKAYDNNKALDQEGKGYITRQDLAKALEKHQPPGWVLGNIQSAKAKLGMEPVLSEAVPVEPSVETSDKWAKSGEDSAKDSARSSQLAEKRNLDRTNLGKSFQQAQRAYIQELKIKLETIASTPPLRMLVNPSSLSVADEKVHTDGSQGRNGPIPQLWGDSMTKVSGSGKVAAFFSLETSTGTGPGLTRAARQYSESYQNLLALTLIYRNNGGVWLTDPFGSTPEAMNLALVGSVYLYYDSNLYIGSFESLSITEDASAPFTLDYSFSFNARYVYLLDQPPETQRTQ